MDRVVHSDFATPARPAAQPSSSQEPAEGRVALVSGGNRGLGLQIVRMLAQQGMRVVLASRSVERGRVAVETLGDIADRVAVRQLDITDPASVSRLAAWLNQWLGRCDVLINNAAVLLDDDADTAADADLQVVQRTLETNLLGTWRLTQAVVPLMRACAYGRIVNISSDLSSLTSMRSGLPAYRISKTAVNSLTRILAVELADNGILVNACCPKPVDREPLFVSADMAAWLATLPRNGPTGGLYQGRSRIEW